MNFCTCQLFQAAHQVLFPFLMITWMDWIIQLLVSNYWDTKHTYTTNGVSIIGDDSYFHCRAVCVHACTRASMGAVPVIASTGPLHIITDLPTMHSVG